MEKLMGQDLFSKIESDLAVGGPGRPYGYSCTINNIRIAEGVVEVSDWVPGFQNLMESSCNSTYDSVLNLYHNEPKGRWVNRVKPTQLEYSQDKTYLYDCDHQHGTISIREMGSRAGGRKPKVSDEEAIEIYNRFQGGEQDVRVLAEEFGVSESTVRRITHKLKD